MSAAAASYEGLVGQLVSLSRAEFREGPHQGFLVAASDSWLVLHAVGDRLDLDGYRCFRTRDITALNPSAPRLEVARRALSMKALAAGDPGPLDLTGTRELLASIEARHGLVVIHRERRAPQECEIGRIRLDSEQTYTLHWLSPDAYWEPAEEVFRYEDVTRTDFGGEYENTLAALAGEPPLSLPLPDQD